MLITLKQIVLRNITVTGRSGSCMQKEQLKLLLRIFRTSVPPAPAASILSSAGLSPSSEPPPLNSCWRLLAFSWSESETSDSMARMAATSAPDGSDPDVTLEGGGEVMRFEQSGHSHCAASARVWGRAERQSRCQGVTQVLQVIFSSSGGLILQIMQQPSPSQGRSLSCAMAGIEGGKEGGRLIRYMGVKSVGICFDDDDDNVEDDDGEYIILIHGNFWCDEQCI